MVFSQQEAKASESQISFLFNHLYVGPIYRIRTTVQAADAQRLSRVQGEPVLAVLDVGLAGHGVEVGLQGELEEAATGLNLPSQRQCGGSVNEQKEEKKKV